MQPRMLAPAAAAAAAAARAGQSRPSSPGGQMTLKELLAHKMATPWDYFDTVYFGVANTFPGGNVNFANIPNPIVFFDGTRKINTSSGSMSDMDDSGKFAADFIAYTISVDVFCLTDIPRTAAVATSEAFAECVIFGGILNFTFDTTPAFITPVAKLPAGGGAFYGPKVRTQTAAADSDSASANNGEPTATAMRRLAEPLVFHAGEAFTASLVFPPPVLLKLQGLTALANNDFAGIRVTLGGIRGKSLVKAFAASGDLANAWNV